MTISASIVSFSPNATMMSSSSYKNKSSSSSIVNNTNNYTSPMTLHHHHRTTSFFVKRQRFNEKKVSTTVMVRAENKGDEEQPKLTRKKEAETEAFLSPAEKSGENPLKDPMAIIGIVGIIGVPALILLVGVTSGYIGQWDIKYIYTHTTVWLMLLIKIVYITTLSSHKIPKGLHISLTFRLVSSPTFYNTTNIIIRSKGTTTNENKT